MGWGSRWATLHVKLKSGAEIKESREQLAGKVSDVYQDFLHWYNCELESNLFCFDTDNLYYQIYRNQIDEIWIDRTSIK